MAAITREVLNADGMSVTIFCGGQSTVGIGVLGTFVGTLSFYGSTDGIIFFPLSATPFASGTDVSTVTATGNWFSAVKNLLAIKVTFTRTSGSAQIVLAAAVDASWQDAFLTAIQTYNNSSATGSTNTLTQAAQANRAWNLKSLVVSIAGPAWSGGTVRLRVYDGTTAGNVLFSQFMPEVAGSVGREYKIDLPDGGLTGTLGNAMTIVLSGVTSSQASELNARFSAA